jgi:formate dehydrogenase (coenzyme F420) beta subunit
MEMIEALRADAAKLLADGRAKMVLGYQARGEHRAPAFITDAAKTAALVFDAACIQNLAAYLRKPEVRRLMPVAVVATPPVMRSLILLQSESQLAADAVLVLAVEGATYHGVLDLAGAAALLKEKFAALAPSAELLAEVKRLGAMTAEGRAAFWTAEFAKCTRCYACRAACPMCYCTRCIVEKNVPQWISTAAAGHGNYAWNIIRAFHLAGRCTLCGSCEAACPQGIPLMLLNAMLDEAVAEEVGSRSGYDPGAKPVIGSFDDEDDNDFIR